MNSLSNVTATDKGRSIVAGVRRAVSEVYPHVRPDAFEFGIYWDSIIGIEREGNTYTLTAQYRRVTVTGESSAYKAALGLLCDGWPVYLPENGDYCGAVTSCGYLIKYLTDAERRDYDGQRLSFSTGSAFTGREVNRPGPSGPAYFPYRYAEHRLPVFAR